LGRKTGEGYKKAAETVGGELENAQPIIPNNQ
jgi:hypothetical protein